jgi:hypothetical protein
MERSRRFAAAVLLLAPTAAAANMGIPMLVLAWPAYWLALLPVIAFEGYLGEGVAGLTRREAMSTAAIGNLWSTFLGIPVVWAGLVAIEMVVGIGVSDSQMQWILFPLFAAWLMPTENIWLVYAAFVVLAIPFCIASIWIETKVAVKRLPNHPPQLIRGWIRRANVWSYAGIVAVAVAFPLTTGQ